MKAIKNEMKKLDKKEIKLIPESTGIYRVYGKTHENYPIPITRFCNTDKSGLLCIGRTTGQNLKTRLYQFFASSNVDMKTHNHSGGLKYCNNPIIRETLGLKHSLYFDFEETDNAAEREEELLKEYKFIFGEYPHL